MRFGDRPINSPYLIHRADFISCSQQSYVERYDLLDGLKPGGTFTQLQLVRCGAGAASDGRL
ncbi:MAG: hypothetical protein ACLR17_14400 [Enterobacteriaceae bacterium]